MFLKFMGQVISSDSGFDVEFVFLFWSTIGKYDLSCVLVGEKIFLTIQLREYLIMDTSQKGLTKRYSTA